jgi:hypothetical protein
MRLEVRDNVLLAYLDQPGSPVNTLGESLSADFETFLARLKSEPGIAGAVLIRLVGYCFYFIKNLFL